MVVTRSLLAGDSNYIYTNPSSVFLQASSLVPGRIILPRLCQSHIPMPVTKPISRGRFWAELVLIRCKLILSKVSPFVSYQRSRTRYKQ